MTQPSISVINGAAIAITVMMPMMAKMFLSIAGSFIPTGTFVYIIHPNTNIVKYQKMTHLGSFGCFVYDAMPSSVWGMQERPRALDVYLHFCEAVQTGVRDACDGGAEGLRNRVVIVVFASSYCDFVSCGLEFITEVCGIIPCAHLIVVRTSRKQKYKKWQDDTCGVHQGAPLLFWFTLQ